MATYAEITDWNRCRDCQALTVIVWCTDGNWRRFDPAISPGAGWWWSKRRGGMVSPDDTPFHPVATYQVHRCPEENLPVGQLEMFPAEAVTQPRRLRVAPTLRRAGGVA
jgi:hypothetical protein